MSSKNSQFHRVQISKAQNYIRNHLVEGFSLPDLASESGVSQFHLIRIFAAYTGETPFEYVQRVKISNSLELLKKSQSILDVSAEVGYETQSSYNKAFKKWTGLSPSEFRNLGKEEQEQLQYSLGMNVKQKEPDMKLNLSEVPEVVVRPQMNIVTVEGRGESFVELAPMVWQDFFGLAAKAQQDLSGCEFLGVSYVSSLGDVHKHVYKVAITVPTHKKVEIPGMIKDVLPEQKYLKFTLKGAYQGVWPAFDSIFRYISENAYKLAPEPCLENYLNDPNITPESELLTELLVPILD